MISRDQIKKEKRFNYLKIIKGSIQFQHKVSELFLIFRKNQSDFWFLLSLKITIYIVVSGFNISNWEILKNLISSLSIKITVCKQNDLDV